MGTSIHSPVHPLEALRNKIELAALPLLGTVLQPLGLSGTPSVGYICLGVIVNFSLCKQINH